MSESDLGAQKSFLIAIGASLPEEDNILWLIENILADLPEDKQELLKAKFRLNGGYHYTDVELKAIFKKSSLKVLRSAVRAALTAARAAYLQRRRK
jgi:hypothetical protein